MFLGEIFLNIEEYPLESNNVVKYFLWNFNPPYLISPLPAIPSHHNPCSQCKHTFFLSAHKLHTMKLVEGLCDL